MAKHIKFIVYPAKDLEAAKVFFGKYLGVEPYVDGAYYVGYKLDDLEVGLDPYGQAIVSYIDTKDIIGSLKELVEAGSTVLQDAKDVGGGLLIAQVRDTNGSVLGLRQSAK